MTEEENKAIDYLKNLDIDFNTLYRINLRDLDNCKKVILNLIEKLKKENERMQTELNGYISKEEIKHIRNKLEVMDYYTIADAVNDLNGLLGEIIGGDV